MSSQFKGFLRLVLSITVFLGIDRLFRWMNRRNIVILLYHGITSEPLNPPCSVQLSRRDFIWQMEYLKRYYHIMPLPDLIRKISRKEQLPDNTAVVTFDDGFENNYTEAYPVLKRLGIPASMFLPTGYIDTDKILWPQELYLMLTATVQKELDMRDQGMGIYDLSFMSNNTSMMTINTQVIDDIRKCIKKLSEEDKQKLLAIMKLRLQVEDLDEKLKRQFSMLSWEQVMEMHQSGLISFGSHTVSHPYLINLDKVAMAREITESFETIKKKLRIKDIIFAYTFGNHEDFNDLSKQVVREHGALCAVTTVGGLNDPGDDLFELKRIFCNVTKDAFKLSICGCLTELKKFRRAP